MAKMPYKQNEDDKGNAIYLGVTWLYGDNLAQIDIAEGKTISAAEKGIQVRKLLLNQSKQCRNGHQFQLILWNP